MIVVIESPVQLAHDVAAGRADAAALDWLREGLARHLAGEPLDVALRLDRASRMRARNHALRRAADALGDCRSTWDRALRLAQAVRRFEARVLPRLKPGAELPPLDQALLDAHRAGVGLPRAPKALVAIL